MSAQVHAIYDAQAREHGFASPLPPPPPCVAPPSRTRAPWPPSPSHQRQAVGVAATAGDGALVPAQQQAGLAEEAGAAAARIAEASLAFLDGVDSLCAFAEERLGELVAQVRANAGACKLACALHAPTLLDTLRPPPPPHTRQADEADRQRLRTAALRLRLGKLAAERRAREAELGAVLAAKRRELEGWVGGWGAGRSTCSRCSFARPRQPRPCNGTHTRDCRLLAEEQRQQQQQQAAAAASASASAPSAAAPSGSSGL